MILKSNHICGIVYCIGRIYLMRPNWYIQRCKACVKVIHVSSFVLLVPQTHYALLLNRISSKQKRVSLINDNDHTNWILATEWPTNIYQSQCLVKYFLYYEYNCERRNKHFIGIVFESFYFDRLIFLIIE